MAEVTVVAEGEEVPSAGEPAEVPAGPQSPLALLRGKREQLEKALFLDLAIPRWEEVLGRKLWVRFRPGNPNVLTAAMTKREKAHLQAVAKNPKAGDKDWLTRANADLLVDACVAVYDLAPDEEPPEGDLPPGDYPTFSSSELSDALGATHNAVDTVLKAYGTGADVLLAATQLLNWSGQASQEASKGFLSS